MKDKQIEQLFEQYADNLQPQTDLAEKARQKMASAASSRPKKFVWWKPLVAVCSVIVFVVVLNAVWGNIFKPEVPDNEFEPNVFVYQKSETQAKSVTASAVEDFISLSELKKSYVVTCETYRAYYFKGTDSLAYVWANFGVLTEQGIVELTVIAETEGVVCQPLLNEYNDYIRGSSALAMAYGNSDNGECVTAGYVNAQNLHFYVYAQCNPSNVSEAEKIIAFFA